MTDVTRRSFLAVYTLAAALLLAGTKRAGGSDLTFSTLQPGATRTIHQNLNINIVFVGIRPGGGPFDVNEAALRGGLPSEGSLVNRFTAGKSDFGPSSPANVSFSYRYNIVYADATFENALFTYLTSIGQLHVRSVAQSAYNRQPARTLTIPNRNLWLNAVATERWLGDHATLLGIDPTEYTVFYLNWFGRSDFQFHSYMKLDERDIDTGFIAGFFTNRRMRAWGGTSGTDPDHAPGPLRRIWFADLSAGPDALAASYEITTADFDGDGVLDYRIPPIWEYGNTAAYRPFTDFTGDLVRLTRYVAIDELFTPSPLYPVALSPPRLPQTIQDDVNVVELDPAVDGRTTFNAAQVTARLHRLRPFNQFGMQVADAPLTGRIVETYNCYANGVSCYASTGPFASLFIYDYDHLTQFLAGGADFEAPVVQYNTRFLAPFGLLGFSTPSLILTFTAANVRASGLGGSLPLIHETGHLLGLSHPQDGYDPGSGVDFEQRGPFTFAGIGVDSSTLM